MIGVRKYSCSFALIFFVISCAPRYSYVPDPTRDVKEWVRDFNYQKSFVYEYELKTSRSKIIAQGECVVNWAEHIKGLWDYGDTMFRFEHIGINDQEWTIRDGKWEQSVRGEESDILAQIKRVLEFEKFEFLDLDADNDFNYRFDAALPYLAPERWREMIAYIRIAKKNYLPSFIWVGLPDSSVYWQIRLKNYNHKLEIKPPYFEMKDYQIVVDSTVDKTKAIKQINRRLKLQNLKWKVWKTKEKIMLQAPDFYSIDDIKELFAPGITTLRGVARDSSEAVLIGSLINDPRKSIYLSDLNISADLVKDVVINFDNQFKPFMLIKLKKKIEFPSHIAIEVDGDIIALLLLDKVKKMDKIRIYLDMPYRDILKIRSFICQPLFRIDILSVARRSD